MIDFLQRVAIRIGVLRRVAIVVGAMCLAALGFIVFGSSASGAGNKYLVPAMVGFIWCLSAYGFIDTFRSVPRKADRTYGLFGRFKQNILRAWFWLLAGAFAASTLAALFLTFKLGSVWLGKYYG
ncbi:MAG: hypothetical protein MAG794_00748 [Gammaproteobacteria bacterium]|nr:hypothetical protein [Gammaproteobacteria bacterium]